MSRINESQSQLTCGPAGTLDNETLVQVLIETYGRSVMHGSEIQHSRWVECKAEVLRRLSALTASGVEGRDPADMFNEELDAAMDFHRSEAARFANERAKIWRLRIRLNGGEDIDKRMLAELHARRAATTPTESGARCGERRCVKCFHGRGVRESGLCAAISDNGYYFCSCKCVFPAAPEAPYVRCPGCSQASDAGKDVYHHPPVCAPTAVPPAGTGDDLPRVKKVPVTSTWSCPSCNNQNVYREGVVSDPQNKCKACGTEVVVGAIRSTDTSSTPTLGEAAVKTCAREIAQKQGDRLGDLSFDEVAAIVRRHFPPSEATPVAGIAGPIGVKPDVEEWLTGQCNRLLYGRCFTARCLKRGGYDGPMADHEQACSIATCEAFELSRQVTQLAEAVTELHPINSSDISQLRAELATARADAIGEAANEAKQRAATLQAVEIQSGNEKDLAYRDGGIAALENLAESLIQQGEGNDGPATHNEA